MSATRSISDLELPVDEEQRHVMPLREPVEYPSSLALLEEQQRQHDAMTFEEQRKQEEKAAMRLRHAMPCREPEDPEYLALLEEEQRQHDEVSFEEQRKEELIVAESRRLHTSYSEGRAAAAVERCALTMERLEGPVRIRPEPADDIDHLERETEDNAKLIAHHQHRCHEEITDIHRKFAYRRENARVALYAQLDRLNAKFVRAIAKLPDHEFEKLHILTAAHAQSLHHATGRYRRKLCSYSPEREAWKGKLIEKRRAELAWTCPNDGQAHPFTFEGRQYHRTYWGEMWRTENWSWQGYWVGYYIKSGKPPRDDEVSDKIREALCA